MEALSGAKQPLVTSHVRIDGDGIGAALGLACLLRGLGRRAHVVTDGPIPKIFRFLPAAGEVGTSADAVRDDHDLVVCLDVPELARVGAVAERLPKSARIVKIDHHVGGDDFGDFNWVDASASSVGEMIYRMARQEGWSITPECATCLHVAIMTDTGRFCFANTTPEAMDAAAHLLECGADLVREVREIYRSQEPGLIRLRGMALQSLRLTNDGQVAWMWITRKMLEDTGAKPIDTQEFADLTQGIGGVRIGVLLRELPRKQRPDGAAGPRVKVSLRSADDVDVRAVAARFGGGGHRAAAGCEIAGTLDEAMSQLEAGISAELRA